MFLFKLGLVCALLAVGLVQNVTSEFTRPTNCQPSNGGDNNDVDTPTCALPVSRLEEALSEQLLPLLGDEDELVPPWFNSTLWTIGQNFAKKHLFGVYLGPIATLSMFTGFPLITPLLLKTGKTKTPYLSNKRYMATMLQMKLWYEQAVTPSDGKMNPHILESLFRTRGIHFSLIRHYNESIYEEQQRAPRITKENYEEYNYEADLWRAFALDLEESNIPQKYRDYPEHIKNFKGKGYPVLNQLSMSVIQWFLWGMAVTHPEQCGIHGATKEELVGYIHLTAVIGYGLGIDDKWNVGLQPSVEAAKRHYMEIYNNYFLPTLFQLTDDGRRLQEHFYRGFIQTIFGNTGDKLVKVDQLLLLSFESVLGIPCPNMRSRLALRDGVLRSGLNQATTLMGQFWIRGMLNGVVNQLYFVQGSRRILELDSNDPQQVAEKSYVY